MLHRIGRILDYLSIILVILVAVTGDSPRLTGSADRTRFFTREIEFDYPNWVWDAAWVKLQQGAIGLPYLYDRATSKQIVFEYLHTTERLIQIESRIEQLHADPSVADKESASAFLRIQRDRLLSRQTSLAPLAEAILQNQISEALAALHLTTGGQPIPPVLYRASPTPLALIVSRRDVIEQVANISVQPTLTLDDQIRLEDEVASSLDVSTLTVGIGGVGVYPTMVMETTNLRWILETIAHEWTHNYLNLRPLGLNYSTTSELRTMNETTASIAGNEVGALVIQNHYPELGFTRISPSPNLSLFPGCCSPSRLVLDDPPFDFRAEMRTTRINVDKFLADGKIEEAEAYMEERRQVFWKNGYLLRKLNQAYFAFHGAYADVPGGAAGEDPVGPAVRALREQSGSLAEFMKVIARMTSFEELQQAIR